MNFSKQTRIMQLQHRIKLLSLREKENVGLIRKAKRELRKLENDE